MPWAHGRTRRATVSKTRSAAVHLDVPLLHATEAATVHHHSTPSLASAGLRGGSVAVNARHGADREAAWP